MAIPSVSYVQHCNDWSNIGRVAAEPQTRIRLNDLIRGQEPGAFGTPSSNPLTHLTHGQMLLALCLTSHDGNARRRTASHARTIEGDE